MGRGGKGAALRTVLRRIGNVIITASVKNSEIAFGGLLGSALKIWWISGCFP